MPFPGTALFFMENIKSSFACFLFKESRSALVVLVHRFQLDQTGAVFLQLHAIDVYAVVVAVLHKYEIPAASGQHTGGQLLRGTPGLADPAVWARHVTWAKVFMAAIAALHEARVVHAGGAATGAEVERALVAAVERTAAAVLEGWSSPPVADYGGRHGMRLKTPPWEAAGG